jgi:hypothetical protein
MQPPIKFRGFTEHCPPLNTRPIELDWAKLQVRDFLPNGLGFDQLKEIRRRSWPKGNAHFSPRSIPIAVSMFTVPAYH